MYIYIYISCNVLLLSCTWICYWSVRYANAIFAVMDDVSLRLEKAARRQNSFYRFSVSAGL